MEGLKRKGSTSLSARLYFHKMRWRRRVMLFARLRTLTVTECPVRGLDTLEWGGVPEVPAALSILLSH
jgi:hypothetical protein